MGNEPSDQRPDDEVARVTSVSKDESQDDPWKECVSNGIADEASPFKKLKAPTTAEDEANSRVPKSTFMKTGSNISLGVGLP